MKKTFAIALLSGVALIASAAPLQRHVGGLVIRHIEYKLNLTSTQRTQIKQVLQSEQPTIRALALRLQEQNAELLTHQGFDEAYVRAFAQQHADTVADVLVEREKVRNEVRSILTPEQQQKLQQMREQQRSRTGDRISDLIDQI